MSNKNHKMNYPPQKNILEEYYTASYSFRFFSYCDMADKEDEILQFHEMGLDDRILQVK